MSAITKKKIQYAKFASNGKVLDIILKALDLDFNTIKSIDAKDWQRFVQEKNLSASRYNEIMDKVLQTIIQRFYENTSDSTHSPTNTLDFCITALHELFKDYNFYKANFETLAATQKMLDFITAAYLFIPYIAKIIPPGALHIPQGKVAAGMLLPDDSGSAMQHALNIIESDLKDSTLDNKIKEIWEHRDEIAGDSDKNLRNWRQGRNTPSLESIQILSELSKHCKNFNKQDIIAMLLFAKIAHYCYEKSRAYFGKELSDLLVEHFRLVEFIMIHENVLESQNRKIESLRDYICIHYGDEMHNIFLLYYNLYCFNAADFTIKQYIFKQNQENKERMEMFNNDYNESGIAPMLFMKEEKFFEYIDFHLPARYFVPHNTGGGDNHL